MPENELKGESSPYLLSHSHNPVHWFPWGEKALNKARDENKLILVSIGYSACHWCHVMERESFEDLEVAEIMNQFFVCIKVDREERPDIDQIYLDAVQIMSGQGGWPLNCFILPNQKPIYGGTYFRKEDWKNILLNLAAYWQKNKEEAEVYAQNLNQELQDKLLPRASKTELPKPEAIRNAWIPYLDKIDGGFMGAPKFPLPNSWIFVLKLHSQFSPDGDSELINFFNLTLNRMLEGGIYDQVGGGFARYSTDNHWFAPHFEKMLYDNAQLLSLYSQAYVFQKNPDYEKGVKETIGFLKRDLDSGEGPFYSALDADSEGVEGKYYVWSQSELRNLLGGFEPSFSLYFHVKPSGNWEGSNILYKKPNNPPLHEKLGMTREELERDILRCTRTLLTHRYNRIPPALDDKILCSWNALLIKGFCDAYKAFADPIYLQDALRIAQFIDKNLIEENRVKRTYKQGIARIAGFLDDYAFLADSYIELYQVSLDSYWIYKALYLVKIMEDNFQDPDSSLFYYTDQRENPLIARKKEIHDSVIPSSNSVLAHVLYKLGHFYYREEYIQRAKDMVMEVLPRIQNYSPSYSHWTSLLLEFHTGTYEICIIGNKAEEMRKELEKHFIPNKLVSAFLPENNNHRILPILENKIPSKEVDTSDKTLIYICRNRVCGLPYDNVEEALKELKER